MRFEWDGHKSRLNLTKHKISFDAVRLVFDDQHALSVQDRTVDEEPRWQTLGMIEGAVVVLVAHTSQEEDGEEVIRIISARKATPRERMAYEESRGEAG